MILTEFRAFKICILTLTLCCCCMTYQAQAAKITRSQQTTANTTMGAETPTTTLATVAKADKRQTPLTPAPDNSFFNTDSFSVWGIARRFWNWIRDDIGESLLAIGDGDDDGNDTTAGALSANNLSLSSARSAKSSSRAVGARTFGKIRRLQMALIPIVFKFGVLSAMVAFLVMIGVKSLFLLKFLILMNLVAILGKFFTLKTDFGHLYQHPHVQPAAPWGGSWNPHAPVQHGWSSSGHDHHAPTIPNKEIHLHIHGAQTQPQVLSHAGHGLTGSGYGYGATPIHSSGWERRSDPYYGYDVSTMNEADAENELNNRGPVTSLPTKYPANHRY